MTDSHRSPHSSQHKRKEEDHPPGAIPLANMLLQPPPALRQAPNPCPMDALPLGDGALSCSSSVKKSGLPSDRHVIVVVPDSACATECSDDADGDESSLQSNCGSEYSSEYDDYDDFSATTDEEVEEDLMVKRLVEYAFAGRGRGNGTSLKRPLDESPRASRLIQEAFAACSKKPRLAMPRQNKTSLLTPPNASLGRSYPPVPSTPSGLPGKRMGISISAPNLLLRQASEASSPKAEPLSSVAPQDFLRSLHEQAGRPFRTVVALEVPAFFVPSAGEYELEIVQAVRTRDLEALRELHRQGRTLQCANRFGESTVHTASRHGSADVLRLLLEEAGASAKVRCDAGRTPLHDACWTAAPPSRGMEAVGVLLDACPDLLYLRDQRGLAPLEYAPREHWAAWCRYLEERGLDRLAAQGLP